MNGVRAVCVGAGALTAGDRLVVGELLVAECQIVHRSLTGRSQSECTEQHIDHTLRCFDVAADDGGKGGRVRSGIQDALRQNDFDGRYDALVQWNIFADEQSQHVHDRGGHDRPIGVEISRGNRPGAGEVDRRAVARDGHGNSDRRAVVEVIDEFAGTRRQLGERDVVSLDEERKAAMVSNLLVVLCADREAQPVVNTGTLYQ